ncbi:HNH endonuclease [Allosphingosinicella deserti]|uniref:HNH endonuclease n=1 Tax=Allosphingosinicella deserti TaxID=2116704 RepID=A0A2P7QRI7_9SPHN|nr:HNH endonuclease [Sphingomonas deserti]PSJ40596.1 HNH endonuclease [Sphingomonas deserti]
MSKFQAELAAQLRRAAARGAGHVDVKSGQLHRTLGGYPATKHQMPSCCDAMYDAQRAGDEIVSAPAKGKGASLTIRYRLPR